MLYVIRFDCDTEKFRVKRDLLDKMLCREIVPNTTHSHLLKLMQEVREAAVEDLEMLYRSSDTVIGMRIIQQFVLDLLGRNTPIAIIFGNKTEAE